MPRKSKNVVSINHNAHRPPLTPPRFLRADEQTVFVELAAMNAHLTQTHAPLLALYAQGILKSSTLSRETDLKSWETCARVTVALGRSLRLTPRSSSRPEKVEIQNARQRASESAQELRNFRLADDED